MRHIFTERSSAAEASSGMTGWKATQFTPRSCPSSTYFTTASLLPKMSLLARAALASSGAPLLTVFLRRPVGGMGR